MESAPQICVQSHRRLSTLTGDCTPAVNMLRKRYCLVCYQKLLLICTAVPYRYYKETGRTLWCALTFIYEGEFATRNVLMSVDWGPGVCETDLEVVEICPAEALVNFNSHSLIICPCRKQRWQCRYFTLFLCCDWLLDSELLVPSSDFMIIFLGERGWHSWRVV